jgi:addiction module RelE/StbE family toxin
MYELTLTSGARRDLKRLDVKIQRQVHRKLERLRENCDEYSHKALKGNYRGQFKLPCGNYRVIYSFNKQTETIEVSQIEHRSSVYKKTKILSRRK